MSDQQEPRKISLAEAVKRKLEQKKQQQASANAKGNKHQQPGSGPTMKSQLNKKPNNQRRRTGV